MVYSKKLDIYSQQLIAFLGHYCIEEKIRYEIKKKYYNYIKKFNEEMMEYNKVCAINKTASKTGIDTIDKHLIEIENIKKKFDRLLNNYNTENIRTAADTIINSKLKITDCSVDEILKEIETAIYLEFNQFFKKDEIQRDDKESQEYFNILPLDKIESFHDITLEKNINSYFNEEFFEFLNRREMILLRQLYYDPYILIYINLYNILYKNIDDANDLLYEIYKKGNNFTKKNPMLQKEEFLEQIPEIAQEIKLKRAKNYGEKFLEIYALSNIMTGILNKCHSAITINNSEIYKELKQSGITKNEHIMKKIKNSGTMEDRFRITLEKYTDIETNEESILIDQSIEKFKEKVKAIKSFNETDFIDERKHFIKITYRSEIENIFSKDSKIFNNTKAEELIEELANKFKLDKNLIIKLFVNLDDLWTKIDYYFNMKKFLKFYYQNDEKTNYYYRNERALIDSGNDFEKLKKETIDLFFSKFTLTFNSQEKNIYELISEVVNDFFENDLSDYDAYLSDTTEKEKTKNKGGIN